MLLSGGVIQKGRLLQERRLLQKQPRWQEGYCEGSRGAGKGKYEVQCATDQSLQDVDSLRIAELDRGSGGNLC